jgi:hypothetical protein
MARRGLVFLTGILAVLHGCGGDDTTGGGAGGSAGSAVPDGGSGGSTMGSGGAAASGGGTGRGGSAGTGGGDGSVNPPACMLPVYANVNRFNGTTAEGWNINTMYSYMPTALDGATMATQLAVDPTDGNPAPGSLKLTMPFDNMMVGEQVLLNTTGFFMTPVNLGGSTISALVKLDSLQGGSASSSIQAFFAIKSTTTYNYAAGPIVNLTQTGVWVPVSINVETAALGAAMPGFNTCDIREIDLILQTGPMGMYGTTVVHIDTIAFTAADAGVPPEPDSGTMPLGDGSTTPGTDSAAGDGSGESATPTQDGASSEAGAGD